MNRDLEELVWSRAGSCCEYCRMPQELDELSFEIDHIVAAIHGGLTITGNLALSCFLCNRYKGTNLAGIDPKSGKLTKLFHPRRNVWHRHFHWHGAMLVGRTPIGRATVRVLQINDLLRVRLRAQLVAERSLRLI